MQLGRSRSVYAHITDYVRGRKSNMKEKTTTTKEQYDIRTKVEKDKKGTTTEELAFSTLNQAICTDKIQVIILTRHSGVVYTYKKKRCLALSSNLPKPRK